jgi:uncharacterized protein involved in exopolysaccharide biosynthesis
MKFTELQSIIEKNFSTSKLADIAHELNVTPQVVSNWKSRNQVPYKYVKKLRNKLSSNDKDLGKMITSDFNNGLNTNNDLEEIIKNIISYYGMIKKRKKIFLLSILISFFISLVYVNFFLYPQYESHARLLPSTNQGNNLTGLASQFGLSIGQENDKMSLVNAELYPEIIKSRKLGKLVLNDTFTTIKYGKPLKLINILNGKPQNTNFDENETKAALIRLQKMIKVGLKKKPLLDISIISFEPKLCSDLIVSIIINLEKLLKSFKISELSEKKRYIGKRIIEVEKTLKEGEDQLRKYREQNRNITFSPALLLEEARLIRGVQVQEQIFITLKSELEMAQIEEYEDISMVQVLDPPQASYNISPSSLTIIFLFFFGGIILGIALIIIIHWFEENKLIFKI